MFLPVGSQEPTPRRRFPAVTVTLVLLNSLVFLLEVFILFSGGEKALRAFITAFGVVPVAVSRGQSILIPFYLTPFTSMFVHAGLIHTGFNMAYLLVFGDNVEDWLGHGRYLFFYLLSGLVAVFAQIGVDPASAIPTVGASGAIAGVLSGYLLRFPRGMVRMFLFLGPFIRFTWVPAFTFVGFWFITQFLSGVASLGVATSQAGGVAYWAHIGGFIAGLVLAIIFRVFLAPTKKRWMA